MSAQKEVELLRRELRESFKNRALIYYLIFDELRQQLGEVEAIELLKRAILRRGRQIGEKFARHGPADMKGLRGDFLGHMPDEGRLFSPEVRQCQDDALDIDLMSCPLKEAWQEAGLDDHDLAIMCRIAGEIDKGTFEAAGFSFEVDTWQPGREGCCRLHVRPGPPTE